VVDGVVVGSESGWWGRWGFVFLLTIGGLVIL